MMPKLRPIPQAIGLLAALTLAAPELQAAVTEIAHEPLITQAEFKPKPNLMVILDDSGSMNWSYMPDVLGSSNNATDEPYTTWYGYRAAQCNGVAYDPKLTYTPPLQANGTPYDNASFTSAWNDGYVSNGTTTNLMGTGTRYDADKLSNSTSSSATFTFTSGVNNSTFAVGDPVTVKRGSNGTSYTGTVSSWDSRKGTYTLVVSVSGLYSGGRGTWRVTTQGPGQIYYTYSGNEAAMGWTYTSSSAVNTTTTFYRECSNSTSSSSSVFKPVTVTANSAEATNYANWYSYYRKRYLLMRTSIGQALQPMDDKYRLGLMTINKRSHSNITHIKDFDASHKGTFYGSLYGAGASGSTPLREALSTAGLYFARKVSSQTQATDPMQYACQRNFALLTTDGYWNESSGTGLNGETLNTLAKVANHYYETDLRTTDLNNCKGADGTTDVCNNILTPTGKGNKDDAKTQHMTTFTIGMGVTGTVPAMTDEQAIAYTNWPTPASGKITTVDDLWHAAIKGRGEHYSAKNAGQLTTAIQSLVTAIQDVTGAGSATSTSVLDLVHGDGNIAFEASYTTGSWFGDVLARELDSRTAAVKPGAPKWSARVQLNAKQPANRKIYFSNGTTTLTEFTWATLPEGLQNHFKNLCSSSPAKLSQCEALSEAHRTTLNTGVDLVAYLRGEHTKETTNTAAPLFRKRDNRLGDIINSKPIHVGKPPFEYSDSGYAQFKASKTNRKKMIYVGANDGMLHALDAATGDELWAYIPTEVIPNLYKLADTKYGTADKEHQYYVDGKTVQGDVKIDGEWKTILVGGLNKGGRSYYALDITDPENPQALWEYKHDNLGLTYSDPIITKLKNGTWVVAFGSGYNNVTPGDGKGHLFVVNAATGALVVTQETTAGSTTTPSGLSKINAWVKSLTDNTVQRFYAGDMLGNVWRFVPEDQTSAPTLKKGVMLLAQMQDASGTPQPITTEPKLREYDGKAIVAISTGRYLGTTDITDTQTQSVATIRDPLSTETDATGWGVVRTNNKFAKITITKSGTTGSGSSTTVDWTTQAGWWTDLPTAGERIALAMEWDGPRLLAASIIPDGDQCKSGGASWLYSFNLANGTTHMQQYSADSLIVGFSVVRNDQGEPKIIVRNSANETTVKDGSGLGGGTTLQRARRVSWRELIR